MDLPPVSVIVPTRNRPEELRRAVGAVLGQDYEGLLECIVVFDQTSPTDVRMEVPHGRTLKAITNRRSPGLAGARNSGADAATGELLAFCDDDDVWLPSKLAAQVDLLAANPGVLTAATGMTVVYEEKRRARVARKQMLNLDDFIGSRVLEVHPSSLVVRRTAFEGAIGPVSEEIPGSYAEDYEWLLRAAKASPIGVVRRPLVDVHWHRSSWFADRWAVIVQALEFLLRKHPEIGRNRRGVARIYGRLAFAEAALGNRGVALRWSRRALRANWREKRAYLAFAVCTNLIKPSTILRMANLTGRGV